MSDQKKTKDQLLAELSRLRKKIRQYEKVSSKPHESLLGKRAQYDDLFSYTSDAICIHDLKGNVLDANQRYLDLLGYSRNEIHSCKIPDFHPQATLKKIKEQNKKLLQKRHIHFEAEFIKKNSEIFLAEITSSLIELDGKQVVQGLIRDITERKRTERILIESEEKFRTLFEQSIDAIFIHERGNIKDVNNSACNMVGYVKKQLLSMTIMDFYPPADREKIKKRINRNEKILKVETQWIRADGNLIDVDIISNVIDFHKGLTQSVVHDITERKLTENKIRESEEKFRAIFDNSLDAIMLTAPDGKILMANPAASRMFGKTEEEIISGARDGIVDITDPNLQKFLKERADKGLYKGELIHKRKDGTKFHCEIASVVFKDKDGNNRSSLIIRDISERKQIEESLRESNQKLALAIEQVEAANKAKSEFLANMSHEIRTPMNAIMGMTGLLLDTTLDEVQMEHLDIIRRSSDALLGIINDILDFSKIEAGKMDLEILDFDLRTALDEIVALPAITAQEKGLEFVYEIDSNIPSLLQGDPGRLRQIILNIASNAVKFTDQGEVILHVSLVEETKTHTKLRFEVIDTGIGISKKDIPRLFQSFHQADASSTRKYGGTGLGLVISKKLVELMGGRIGVESIQDKGTTFWFTVIFEKQHDMEEKALIPPVDIQDKRVLIVDDNKTNLEILQRYVEAWGLVCDAAWNGDMALTLLNAAVKSKAPYDIVITDMQMPHMDGKELGQRIKADPRLKDAHMVVLSSRGMRGDAAAMKKIGFSAYLTKPVRRSQLFDCLVLVLSGKSEIKARDQLITRHTITEARKRNVRILIAEDNIVNQKLALRLLEKFGFRADAVANGKEAVHSLGMIPYHLVLMDVQMPVMDGLEATRVIRDPDSKVNNHNVPIIAMTAHALVGDRERCLEAGMNEYISKPINPNDLLKAIEEQLTIHLKNALVKPEF